MPEGAWEVTTKVTGPMYTAYQQAGIVVYGDDDNYAKLVFSGRSSSGDKAGRIIQFSHEQGGGAAQEANTPASGRRLPGHRLAQAGQRRDEPDAELLDRRDQLDRRRRLEWTGWEAVRKSTPRSITRGSA